MHPFVESCRKWKYVVFVIVYLSFLLDNVLLTVVVPIIPDYLFSNDINASSHKKYTGPASLSPLQRKYDALEADNEPLGALLASKAFVQLASTPIVGYLTGTLGCNVLLLLGSCSMLLASILYAYGKSYGMLVLARGLHGCSSGAISVSGMCLLAQNVPKETRFKVMPVAFGGIAVGVLIGYPFGGAAYQLLGKSAPFILIAALISLNIALQWFCLEENDIPPDEPVEKLKWYTMIQDKQTLIATGAICICTSSMAILEPCVPMWLLAQMDPPPSRWQLGAVFIPDSVGYFLGSHFTGLLPVKPWRVSLSAMVLTGLSCCAIPLATSIKQLTVPHFFLGLGVGAVDATMVPLFAYFVDSKGGWQYGPVYALQQISVCLAYSFGPLFGGKAVHYVGFPWLMRVAGFLNIMYCPLMLELEDKDKSRITLKDDEASYSYSSMENSHSQ